MLFDYESLKKAEQLVSDCNAAKEILQESLSPLLLEAENNLYAMREVAEAYRVGSFLPQSDDMYYYYLKQIVSSDLAQYVIEQGKYLSYDLDHGMPYGGHFGRYRDVYEFSELIGYAAFDLGLRYYGSSSPDELRMAIDYFEIADPLFTLSGAGIQQYIDIAKKRLADYRAPVPSEGVLGDFVLKYQQQLAGYIEEDIWNRLDPKSRIFISTAFYCHQQFKDEPTARDGEMDYSPVITLLSKALELELKKRFYDSYLKYLRHSFSDDAEKYIDYNDLDPGKNRVILYQNPRRKYLFVNPDINDTFTLGSFPYIVASGTHGNDKIYPSAADYCKDVLFSYDCELFRNDSSAYKREIERWLKNYITEVETVRPVRNQSAHPNSILRDADAVFCQDVIIRVKHLIDKLIRICAE